MASTFNDNIDPAFPKAIDDRTGRFINGAWRGFLTVAEANTKIVYRNKGLTVWVGEKEYCYLRGTADNQLVLKHPEKEQVILTGLNPAWYSDEGHTAKLTAAGNINLAYSADTVPAHTTLVFYQDATGSRTLHINGKPVSVNPAAGSPTLIGLVWDGVTLIILSNYAGTTSEPPTTTTTLAAPSISAVAVSNSRIDVTVGAVADASSYVTEFAPNGSNSWTQLSTLSGTYSHTGLTGSTTYNYRARAIGNGSTYLTSANATASATTQAAAPANTPPSVAQQIAPVSGDVGTTGSVSLVGKFADAESAMTYTATSSNTGLATVSISGSTLNYSIVGQGSATITVTATDAGNLSVSQTFTITGNAVVNQSPVESTAWWSRYKASQNVSTQVSGTDTLVNRVKNLALANTDTDLQQATLAKMPKFIASGINGKPAFHIADGKSLGSGTFPEQLTRPFTRVGVFRFNAVPAAYKYALSYATASGIADFGHTNNQKFMMVGDANTVLEGALTVLPNTTYIVFMEFQPTGTNSRMIVNGTVDASGNSGAHTNMNGVVLGNDAGIAADVLISETMDYPGIFTAEQETAILNELKTEYGVA